MTEEADRKEADRKVEQDLIETRRLIAESNRVLRRIEIAAKEYLGEGVGDGRTKPA